MGEDDWGGSTKVEKNKPKKDENHYRLKDGGDDYGSNVYGGDSNGTAKAAGNKDGGGWDDLDFETADSFESSTDKPLSKNTLKTSNKLPPKTSEKLSSKKNTGATSGVDLIDFDDLEIKCSKDKNPKKAFDDDAWAMLDG